MKILVLSKGLIHPSVLARNSLELLLKSLDDNFDFITTSNLNELKNLQRNNYDAVLLYYHLKSMKNDNLKALIDYVKNGGGVLALHSSMASLKDNVAYQDLLGGRFIGHGKVEKIKVDIHDNNHPISSGVSGFEIKDELYLHEYDQNNEIIYSVQTGTNYEPVLWTRSYGQGRVCYFALGHCFHVWQHPEVKRILRNSLHWLAD